MALGEFCALYNQTNLEELASMFCACRDGFQM